MIRSILCFMLSLLLFGCDKDGNLLQEPGLDRLQRGVSSEGDVRSVMGAPDRVYEDSDGTRALQYPKGPAGTRTWEFLIGRDGRLVDYRQLLTEENFARIKPGMTREEVHRILGRERKIERYARKNEEVLDWRYLSPFGEQFFNVHFDISTGRVTGTSSQDARNY
ncbi:outer membrane protein assembly factor BamE [Noviherbaspirillum aridicola]|uniref:Beta-barrel assembly machine subunit BamE n=1 Tax=Noviherbaspirillum aridicola TaxID=2849687 RepID=A0ABQ4Q010_9BURK|nr:outer membrane protein assembly factor BamE [Noviherbaspirillum aridicola]GIZ50095.1 hypothetical protein NCCP691_01090 [Noviherbaspirillum aridicola]